MDRFRCGLMFNHPEQNGQEREKGISSTIKNETVILAGNKAINREKRTREKRVSIVFSGHEYSCGLLIDYILIS